MPLGVLTGFLRGIRRVPRSGFLALSPKRAPTGYHKGNRCIPVGRHTSKGKYILIDEKVPRYIVPDLTGFKLKPYVAHDTPKLELVKEEASES